MSQDGVALVQILDRLDGLTVGYASSYTLFASTSHLVSSCRQQQILQRLQGVDNRLQGIDDRLQVLQVIDDHLER
jgi:hypothetical protein